ncbi:MAG TPA: hypothetical protein PKX92_05875 [Edaphocola sp.]|nr:hypothetical protein [Edaphocola sp.]
MTSTLKLLKIILFTALFFLVKLQVYGFETQEYFTGKIKYKSNFTDFKGNDINKKVDSWFDLEQSMYFNQYNFKIINDQNKYLKLFQGKHNAYFYFNSDNSAYKIDQSSKTTQIVNVIEVDDVDTILGYPCEAVKIETDFRAYIYFFNPQIKIDTTPYINYNMEAWNVYLKESEGALPLRVIVIDIKSKYVEDRRAVEVTNLPLMTSDFDFPKNIKLRHLKYGIDLIW